MSRRRKHPAHVNHERWLVSYADFITLLFAFFVVMYSSSQVDNRKVGQIAAAIQVAFEKLGMFPPASDRLSAATMPVSGKPATSEALDHQLHGSLAQLSKTGSNSDTVANESGLSHASLVKLRRELERALERELSRHDLTLRNTPRGLVISLQEVGFFETGSATIRPDARLALAHVAAVLKTTAFQLRIEGHTDNVPIHTAQFPSNWELSTARATAVVRSFIVDFAFPPEDLSGAGFAEYHPDASNATAEGRQLNRRVDIVVLPPPAAAPPASPGASAAASQAQPASR